MKIILADEQSKDRLMRELSKGTDGILKDVNILSLSSALKEKQDDALQRKIDHHSYHTYDQLEEAAVKAAEEEIDLAKKTLPETEDRSKLIAEYVIHWFVLKKLLYVQYMVNKQILQVDHQGDVKSQRRKAREYAAKIPFISYSDMWRMEKTAGETA